MTDIAYYNEPSTMLVSSDPTGGRLVAWAASLQAAHQIGKALCNTSFVPATFKGKPEEAAAAILFGDEIGLTPTQALQSVYVISGKPALYARAMVAIVLAAGHDIITVEKSDAKVTVQGRRRGTEAWVVETWTTARAVKAGYTNNKKYTSDPQAMLYARAASDLCRQIAPDALAGIGYSVEELEVAEPAKVTVTREPSTEGPKKVSRAKAPEPLEPSFDEPEPAVDTETGEIDEAELVEEVTPEAPAIDMITAPQTRMMGALMKELGVTDREHALVYCIDVIRRDVTSRNELTKVEASAVIEALNADKVAQEAATSLPAEPMFDEDGAA